MRWYLAERGLMREVLAVLSKELRAESRSRHGLWTAGLFSTLAAVAVAFSAQYDRLTPGAAAGLLSVTLLFAAVVSLPRTFLVEDEQGTMDLLRLMARPASAYLGKSLYTLMLMLVTGLVLGVLFTAMGGLEVPRPWLLVAGLVAECLALSAGVSLCGALVVGASNRWVLAAALAMPLLLPQTALAVGVFRSAFGFGTLEEGLQNLWGLLGFAIAMHGIGPLVVGSVWKTE